LAAWTAALRRPWPAPPATVLDAGAGTGFLPLLLAWRGYQASTVDLSAAMLQILTSKAAPAGSTSAEPRAAVTDAQNMQLCAIGPKANLLSICGA
jgi:SAM-dependent methyltransferase